MGSFGDWFSPSDVAYPGWSGTNGGNSRGNVQPPERQGFFNRFFAPSELPYPVPAFTGGPIAPLPTPAQPAPVPDPATPTPASSTPTPAASSPAGSAATNTTTPAASSPTPAASQSPVTVIVQACSPAASGDGSGSASGSSPAVPRGDAGVASAMPIGGCPVTPAESIVVAYSTNPRLRARHPRAQELLVEEMLGDESVTLRMLSKDSAPISFVVPDGCNAVDFTFGAIEVNPEHGHDGDLDEVVTVGAINIGDVADGMPLRPGDEITVVVPWRHGSWVEMAAGHLRVPIVARFYQIETA